MIKKTVLIFESLLAEDRSQVVRATRGREKIFILEPQYAYHYDSTPRFSAPPIPSYVQELLDSGAASLLKASELGSIDLYQEPASWAAEQISKVEPFYRSIRRSAFGLLHRCKGGHEEADAALLKSLCDQMAECRSIQLLLCALANRFPNESVVLSTRFDTHAFIKIRRILSTAGLSVDCPKNARMVSRSTRSLGMLRSTILFAAKVGAGKLPVWVPSRDVKGARIRLLMTVISPGRQLARNQRGPDFLVDGKNLHARDVAYLPLAKLTAWQRKQLSSFGSPVCEPRIAGISLSQIAPATFLILWGLCALRGNKEREVVASYIYTFSLWNTMLRHFRVTNFISHADFSRGHFGRNAALRAAGTTTWYFTDSMNAGLNYRHENAHCRKLHPFWTYLRYDYFVTWTAALSAYFAEHSGGIQKSVVVGCLWASHIRKSAQVDRVTVAAFDTTYTASGFTTYEEGLSFAQDLLSIVEENSNMRVLFKEKKPRDVHARLDAKHGPALRALYDRMAESERIEFLGDSEDSSAIMSRASAIVSFPFTSTTFEALAANIPAIWHDPLARYISTPYGLLPGVTTKSYGELLSFVRTVETRTYVDPFPAGSALMDPFRDGKAIERFRSILSNEPSIA